MDDLWLTLFVCAILGTSAGIKVGPSAAEFARDKYGDRKLPDILCIVCASVLITAFMTFMIILQLRESENRDQSLSEGLAENKSCEICGAPAKWDIMTLYHGAVIGHRYACDIHREKVETTSAPNSLPSAQGFVHWLAIMLFWGLSCCIAWPLTALIGVYF